MRNAFLIAWREYTENAKTKGFWLSLFLMPAILFLSAQVPIWLEQKATPTRYFFLVDPSGSFAPLIESNVERSHERRTLEALREYARKQSVTTGSQAGGGATPDPLAELSESNPRALEVFIAKGGQDHFLRGLRPRLRPDAPEFKAPRRVFQSVPVPEGIDIKASPDVVAEQLKPYLRGEKSILVDQQPAEVSAAILIPPDLEKQIVRPGSGRSAVAAMAQPVQYWSLNASEFRLREEVERAVNAEMRRREYLARGMDSAAIREVEQTYVPFASLSPKKERGREAINTADTIKQWAPSAFVYLLWLAIFVIIQMLLNNTIEEKSNRIIEVLLSSVTPGELMMGKLLGIAAVGLTMVGAWVVALFGVVSWKAGGASELAVQVMGVLKGTNLVPLFVVYFLLGYVMYSAFILSVGSVCNTLKEAQSYMGLLTMIMMVPLLTMTFIPKDPNGTLARVLSWIPLYTPFTMMNRAGADPPMVDFIGTFVLLLVTTLLALWMTGKIFRIGILRTGQPPKLLEMLRWATRRED
jgi:ABC-2 type transport system permease protein